MFKTTTEPQRTIPSFSLLDLIEVCSVEIRTANSNPSLPQRYASLQQGEAMNHTWKRDFYMVS